MRRQYLLALLCVAAVWRVGTYGAAPKVEGTYDKFEDVTTLKMPLPGVTPQSEGLEARGSIESRYKGRVPPKEPGGSVRLSLTFKGTNTDAEWPYQRPITPGEANVVKISVQLLLDGQKANARILPKLIFDESRGERGIEFGLSGDTVLQVSKGRKLSIRVSTTDAIYDVDLGAEAIDAIRVLAKAARVIK